VTYIGTQAFQQSNLTTIDFEANSALTSIASAAFQNIPLTSIVLPDSVTNLGNYQFWVDSSLTSVVLPANLNTLQEYTFGQATALNAITLPIGLASIEANAFAVNTALTSYTYCGLTISSAALNAGGLTGKTRNCTAAAIALSSTSEIVAPNTPLTGYTITSPNNFGGGVANYSISPNISNTPGLSFSTTTGRITGTPTTAAAAQTYTISANNYASPSGTATFTITVGTPPPPPPIPDPIQLSSVTGISPQSAAPGNATPVVISGKFVEKITNISINGNNLPAGSWSQSPTSISLTIPKGDAGKYEITLYNGSAPLLKVPTFTYTSPTELTWTLQKAANNYAWNSVAFGEGKFVAVGPSTNGDGAMYSTDGKNWIAGSDVPNNDWQSVAYGNGTFVAVSKNGTRNRIITSDDGINWKISSIYQDFPWGWVKFGNGHFVIASRSEGSFSLMKQPWIFHSVDGISWTKSPITYISNVDPAGKAVTSLSFGNGVFTLTGASTTGALAYQPMILNSFDGINWSHKPRWPGVTRGVTSITYGCERYVGIGKSGVVDITADPQDWNSFNKTALIPAISFRGNILGLNEVIYTSGLFLSVGSGTSGLSSNALSWKEQILPSRNNWVSVTFGNGIFVAVANSGSDHRVMTAPYAPMNLSRTSETIALGDAVAGFTPNFRGCPSATYSITPNVTDSGLTFNASTGQLTGTPKTAAAAKEYTVTLLDGSEYPATATYTLTISGVKAPVSNNAGGSSAPSGSTSAPSSSSGTSASPSAPRENANPQPPVTSLPKPETSTPVVVVPKPETSTPVIEVPKPSETTTVTAPPVVKGGPLESTLTLNVYFDMGSSKVYGSNLSKLQDLAKRLSGLGKEITISITGYAQPTPGSEATDGKLSEDRAAAVARILRKFGVTTKVIYKGAGRAILNVPSSRYVEIVAANSEE
jgi:outer membrane protein OmpA-like peptidoglycan-associated protein